MVELKIADSACELMLAVDTPPQSPVLQIANRESCILVTNEAEVIHEAAAAHEVGVKYEANVTHKAEQVRGCPGFLKSPRLTITGRNMSELYVQATTYGSFSM